MNGNAVACGCDAANALGKRLFVLLAILMLMLPVVAGCAPPRLLAAT